MRISKVNLGSQAPQRQSKSQKSTSFKGQVHLCYKTAVNKDSSAVFASILNNKNVSPPMKEVLSFVENLGGAKGFYKRMNKKDKFNIILQEDNSVVLNFNDKVSQPLVDKNETSKFLTNIVTPVLKKKPAGKMQQADSNNLNHFNNQLKGLRKIFRRIKQGIEV